jgi:hypothetical protein
MTTPPLLTTAHLYQEAGTCSREEAHGSHAAGCQGMPQMHIVSTVTAGGRQPHTPPILTQHLNKHYFVSDSVAPASSSTGNSVLIYSSHCRSTMQSVRVELKCRKVSSVVHVEANIID